MQNNPQQALDERIHALTEHMATIRRNMEKTIADNHRMREVVRIAENELRKRRDQVQQLENELESLQNSRIEAKARVEHAIEKLDELMVNQEEVS
jgi:phage shock protein A